jgi:hypothetical protein
MNSMEVRTEYRCQQWAEVIRERQASGLKAKDFCAGRGIKSRQYYYWLKRLRDLATEQLTLTTPKLVSVELPAPIHAPNSNSSFSSNRYILRYRAAEVEIPEDGNPEMLNMILGALNRYAK